MKSLQKYTPHQFDTIRSDFKDIIILENQSLYIKNLLEKSENQYTSSFVTKFISDILYYSITTILQRQTIGQEYFHLILFCAKYKSIPTKIKGFIFIFLKVTLKVLSKKRFNKLLFKILAVMYILLSKLNQALYLFNKNSYYQIENRLTQIKYLKLSKVDNGLVPKMSILKLLGLLELMKQVITFYEISRQLYSIRRKCLPKSSIQNHSYFQIRIDSFKKIKKSKCTICLDFIQRATLANCGHMFCWNCIIKYLYYAKDVCCPTCRSHFSYKSIVYLYNYSH